MILVKKQCRHVAIFIIFILLATHFLCSSVTAAGQQDSLTAALIDPHQELYIEEHVETDNLFRVAPENQETAQQPNTMRGYIANNQSMSLMTGSTHSGVVINGQVLTWGNNGSGRLGDGTTTHRITPDVVKGEGGVGTLTNIVSVAGGSSQTIALRSDGTVWTWGHNTDGRLGDGTTTNRKFPVQVKGTGGNGWLTDVIAVDTGTGYSAALKSNGTVWSWGSNEDGKLGDGTTTDRITPVQVKSSEEQ